MVQWMAGDTITYITKNGEIRKVKDFRKRIRYSLNSVFVGTVSAGEEMRVDRMCERLIGSTLMINQLIDVNDTDVLSLAEGDVIHFQRSVAK
jgi:hypothetical protein